MLAKPGEQFWILDSGFWVWHGLGDAETYAISEPSATGRTLKNLRHSRWGVPMSNPKSKI
jgi:hypothetical protein